MDIQLPHLFLFGLSKPFQLPQCPHYFLFSFRLHEVLMDLQQQQLQQLSDWLSQTEERIMKMETEAPAKTLEIYKEKIEQHRVSAAFYILPHIPEVDMTQLL